jgi:hypothetical protein
MIAAVEERPLPLVVAVEMVVLLEEDMCMKETPRAAPRGGYSPQFGRCLFGTRW